MSLISYAQNNEDIMLWRALNHISKGTYIDVGASHPIVDSVTKIFYDRGWNGLNIEPVLSEFELLESERPRDINLQVIVGKKNGSSELWVPDVRGWATVDQGVIQEQKSQGHNGTMHTVNSRPLTDLCDEHISGDIHFLKIDTEGSEKDVLESINFLKYRPWILIVEATRPGTQIETHLNWENIVFSADYLLAYKDGLNRFYVAKEQHNLLVKFNYPPNVFDNFIKLSEHIHKKSADQEKLRADEANEKLNKEAIHSACESIRADQEKLRADVANEKLNKNVLVITSKKISKLRKSILHAINRFTPLKIHKFLRRIRRLRKNISRAMKKVTSKDSTRIISQHKKQIKRNDSATPQTIHAQNPAKAFKNMYNNKTMIYIYVDHVSMFRLNTGLQQVTRNCLIELVLTNKAVVPVKWCIKENTFRLLSREETDILLLFCDALTNKHKEKLYQLTNLEPYTCIINSRKPGILFVPEVTYINHHGKNLTKEILREAQNHNLRTTFIFYDDTPLRFAKLNGMKFNHEEYMDYLSRADIVIPISKKAKKDLVAYWESNKIQPQKNLVLQPIHLANSFSKHNVQHTRLTDKPFILSVGSITPHKNQMKLVEAFIKFKDNNADSIYQLILIGNCDKELEKPLFESCRNRDDIIHLGNTSNETIINAYKTCEFTVFPSTLEGFGLPIIESVFFDKPCITANFGAMNEVASMTPGCLVTNTLSTEDLSNSIQVLCTDPEKLSQLTTQAQAHKVKSWSDYINDLDNLWIKHLSKHRKYEVQGVDTDHLNSRRLQRDKRKFFVKIRHLGRDISRATKKAASKICKLRKNISRALKKVKSKVTRWITSKASKKVPSTVKTHVCMNTDNHLNHLHQKSNKPKRIFWLGMHKLLTRTELTRLRELGYEVFNPPYLSDIWDQSANYDWDHNQKTTLPPSVFKTLSKTNFFYVDELNKESIDILNTYFDTAIVTISANWLAPILRSFKGKIIYRVYGQTHKLSNEFFHLKIAELARNNKKFFFSPHASEAVDDEDRWLIDQAVVAPYCLLDSVFLHYNSWTNQPINGDVGLTCPNIDNAYFRAHYDNVMKKHFTESHYKFFGVQENEKNDPAIVGTLSIEELYRRFQNLACYVYSYHESNVCYLPPIECMVIGVPVLFPRGCLLDKYHSDIVPAGRFESFEECKKLVARIRSGDQQLINDIKRTQCLIINRYAPKAVWQKFDKTIKHLVESH